MVRLFTILCEIMVGYRPQITDHPRRGALKESDPLIGTTVGNYRIIKCMGTGGMGAVYHAEHPEIESKVAIKVLLPRYVSSPDIVKRFFDEARAVNRIGHPGIVRIHDCNRQDGVGVYLVMELLEGETVAERYEAQGKFSIDVVVRLMQQVASALDASHKSGIVHRDLKPTNIFIVPDPDIQGGERVKILDFGIAKLLEEHGIMGGDTQTGTIIGSPLYMSPEQCIDSKTVDHRTDIYSLGAVAYRLLTGTFPFEADTLGRLIMKQYKEKPKPLISLRPDVTSDLEWVVETALEVDREARFQSMEELRDAVREAMEVTEVKLIEESVLDSWQKPKKEKEESSEPPDPPALPESLVPPPRSREKKKEPAARRAAKPSSAAPPRRPAEPIPEPAKPRSQVASPEASKQQQTTLSGTAGERQQAEPARRNRGMVLAIGMAAALGALIAMLMVHHYGKKNVLPGVSDPGPGAISANPGPRGVPGKISITLELTPPHAEVLLDGQPTSNPLVLDADNRRHDIKIQAVGYESVERKVTADATRTLKIILQEAPAKGN